MKKIEVSDIPMYIENAPLDMNLMFVGDTGIGKTTVVEDYCKDNGIYLKTLILSQIEASESLGIPIPSKRVYNGVEYNTLDTAIPKWVFDLAEQENPILFLDEFLSAQPSVQNAFLNFLTQKEVHGISLKHVRIVAATNIGMYSFDPDDNILARFCFFYAINSKANEFVNDSRINYKYNDSTALDGRLFEPRDLKPRCFHWLSKVENNDLYPDYHEGFTNKLISYTIHHDEDINEIVQPYFHKQALTGMYSLTERNANMAALMIRSHLSRARKFDKIVDGFVNVDEEAINLLKQNLDVE